MLTTNLQTCDFLIARQEIHIISDSSPLQLQRQVLNPLVTSTATSVHRLQDDLDE
jgi:hypothetical protein